MSDWTQWLTGAGIAGLGALAILALRRARHLGRRRRAANDPRFDQDVGAQVTVARWQAGRGRALYRDMLWDVELHAGAAPQPGEFTIVDVRGNRLIVKAQS